MSAVVEGDGLVRTRVTRSSLKAGCAEPRTCHFSTKRKAQTAGTRLQRIRGLTVNLSLTYHAATCNK